MDFKALINKIDSLDKPNETLTESVVAEKAVSKKQQKFMGMVHAAQKGEKPASKEVAKVAKDMKKSDAKDFASTKHKGLPEKKKAKKESIEFNASAFREKFQDIVEAKKSKPDFLDVDKDGNKKEPMKKALKDKKVKEDNATMKAAFDKAGGPEGVAKKIAGAAAGAAAGGAKPKAGVDTDTLKKVAGAAAKGIGSAAAAGAAGAAKNKNSNEACSSKKGKKKMNESATPMNFIQMMKMVKESGGQQAIDPLDDILWSWANRVASSKIEEGQKREVFAAMVYERNGGRFEMYDVVEKALNEDAE